jgi:heme oxygenase
MALRDILRARTRAHHDAAEAALSLAGSDLSRYARYLQAMHAVHAGFEPRLRDAGWEVRKLAWLQSDLAYLDAAAPPPAACPLPSDPVALAGSAYVLEGAALGARMLYKRWAPALGVSLGRGASFLFGHGDDTGRRWAEFVAQLESRELSTAQVDACVSAAAATFEAIVAAFQSIEAAAEPEPVS